MKKGVFSLLTTIFIFPLFLHTQENLSTTSQQTAQAKVDEDKTQYIASDPHERRRFINDIVFSRDTSKVDEILPYINDESKIVRMAAIEGLGILRASKYEDKIIDILVNDPDKEIKNSSIIALSYLYPLKNYRRIVDYYFNEKDEFIKNQIIRLLAFKNVKELEDEMIKVLSSDKTSRELKLNALYYLGVIKSTQSVPTIQRYLSDEDKLIRLEAIRAAGEIGDRSFIELLRVRVRENDDEIRIDSALALAKMGDSSGLEYMYDYITSPNLSYRDKSLTVIGSVGDERSIKKLNEKLKDITDENLKSFITFTIEKIKARLKASGKTLNQ